ncbi:GntR family transcriptional regulator [Variovorax sp. J22R115]|uniref:GntR family transcriptional regulator n=1 Tax=Variovorax sp. J22R115 TaxID=3053509 RepID=UPI0025759445|nr:GntR family transcriptional regulator [Variovorax sp. J22R115]MDM0052599.1 GntR family transcriptional regulator [Variovorax sp. J22R115]
MQNTKMPGAPTATLGEAVRQSIIRDLSVGALQPGHPLDERALSERFEVSRTPIREAILQLAAQGFLVISPRSGASVPRLSIVLLRELLELLGELEGIAATFAAKRIRPQEKAELAESIAQCTAAAEADDAAAYQIANDRFHGLIYAASRNGSLVEQIRSLRTRSAAYTVNRFDSPGRMKRSALEHAAIAKGVLDNDAAAAHAAMLNHISIGGKDFAEFVSGIPTELLDGGG